MENLKALSELEKLKNEKFKKSEAKVPAQLSRSQVEHLEQTKDLRKHYKKLWLEMRNKENSQWDDRKQSPETLGYFKRFNPRHFDPFEFYQTIVKCYWALGLERPHIAHIILLMDELFKYFEGLPESVLMKLFEQIQTGEIDVRKDLSLANICKTFRQKMESDNKRTISQHKFYKREFRDGSTLWVTD